MPLLLESQLPTTPFLPTPPSQSPAPARLGLSGPSGNGSCVTLDKTRPSLAAPPRSTHPRRSDILKAVNDGTGVQRSVPGPATTAEQGPGRPGSPGVGTRSAGKMEPTRRGQMTAAPYP